MFLFVNWLIQVLVALLAPRSSSAFCSRPSSLYYKSRNTCNHHKKHVLHVTTVAHLNNKNVDWSIITLGDLHMEDDMTFHNQARQDCIQAVKEYGSTQRSVTITKEELHALEQRLAGDLTSQELELLLMSRQQQQQGEDPSSHTTIINKAHMVSLGDLGRGKKNSRHEPGDAGTTKCFEMAKEYLDGFVLDNNGVSSYDLVAGNHDIEGLDEFETDQENLKAWMDCFEKPTPQFHRYIGDKTLLLGLSTVQFREAPYSSHEVHVDDSQIEWFQQMVESHSAEDGWKILVFSHAPIMGSGLRVLQNVHVTSGCAWLNHCSENRNKFIEIVQANPQIKCWSSGHFHLSHENRDSLVQVGSCTFVQVGVMGPKSTRDGRRQTRLFRKCSADESIEIYSINHHVRIPVSSNKDGDEDGETKAQVRLDATIDLKSGQLIYPPEEQQIHQEEDGSDSTSTIADFAPKKGQEWFLAYVPQEEDGCYLEDLDGSIGDASSDKVCWWHMADGKVLGLHRGQLVEYDATTLAPLGVVVLEEQLKNREVMVVQNKTTLVLVDDRTQEIEVVHPNADGSYWRKLSKSKVIRLEEKAREEVANRWMEQNKQQRQREEESRAM